MNPTSMSNEGGHVMPSQPSTASIGRRIARWLGVTGTLSLATGLALAAVPAAHASASEPSAASGQAWVRFAHLASGAKAVKVSIDGKVVTSAAAFESVTAYQVEPAGKVSISIKGGGLSLNKSIQVSAGSATTVAAMTMKGHIGIQTFGDNLSAAPNGDAKVRVLDADVSTSALSAKFAAVEKASSKPSTAAIHLAGVVPKIPYGTASAYLNVPAGHYNVTVGNQKGKTILEGKDWPVSAGTVATLVIVRSSAQPTLVVFDDAAAASSAPTGGMQTGFGGTSLPSSHGDLGLDALGAAGLVIGIAFTRRRLAGLRH
jgi:hypothetical protein